MPDYIYLLENRLSPDQQNSIRKTVEAARAHGLPVFLAGGAVRDFTSGFPVRDLDLYVQGNPLKLRKELEKSGAAVYGLHEPSQTLSLKFPGGVRMELGATRAETYPKPGKTEYRHGASMLEDLRRRDFTVNAMALSLNEGSYGLLLDPMNGVADIDSRTLRLITNTSFYDDPSRLVRAARFVSRYNWTMDERTQQRYDNAKGDDAIGYISSFARGSELEEIAHEEDTLRVLRHLEAEGWMKALFPGWTAAKADAAGLEELRDTLHALQAQGVNPDAAAASMEFLTAKMQAKDVAALKKLLPNKGFVAEWEGLEDSAKEFAKVLTGKDVTTPSATWKLITSYKPEAVLWLAMTGKGAAVQTKFRNFFTVWPEARQRLPYAIMQEMRITPEIPGYQDLQRELFFQYMDNKLKTEEEVRKFLEPHSPPAPPPPPSLRRPRPKKVAEKSRSRKAAVPAQVKQAIAAEGPNPDAVGGPKLPTPGEKKLVETAAQEKRLVADAKAKQPVASTVKKAAVPAKKVAATTGGPKKAAGKIVPPNAKVKQGAKPAKKTAKPAAKRATKPAAKKAQKPAVKKAPARKAVVKKAAAKKPAPKKPAARKSGAKKK